MAENKKEKRVYTAEEQARIDAYRAIKKPELVAMCKEIGEEAIDWLIEELNKDKEKKVYPRKSIINEEGKKVSVADKTKEPIIKMGKKSFVDVKYEFIKKFKPEMLPPAAPEKEESLLDMLTKLKASN
jgi:hypothetical protein